LHSYPGEDCTVRSFAIYYYGDEIKEDEMDGACNTNGRD
jgi:hypothetical protein